MPIELTTWVPAELVLGHRAVAVRVLPRPGRGAVRYPGRRGTAAQAAEAEAVGYRQIGEISSQDGFDCPLLLFSLRNSVLDSCLGVVQHDSDLASCGKPILSCQCVSSDDQT